MREVFSIMWMLSCVCERTFFKLCVWEHKQWLCSVIFMPCGLCLRWLILWFSCLFILWFFFLCFPILWEKQSQDKTKDGRPTPPKDGHPTPPKDGRPTPPKDGRPTQPKDCRHTQPKDGRHTVPNDGRHTVPKDGRPIPPKDGRPTPPKDGRLIPSGFHWALQDTGHRVMKFKPVYCGCWSPWHMKMVINAAI